MGEGWTAIVLERAEHGIGVDLVAGRSQEAAAVIAAEIVAARGDRALVVKDVAARGASFEDSIPDLKYCIAAADEDAATSASAVIADCAMGNCEACRGIATAGDAPTVNASRIAADRAIPYGGYSAANDVNASATTRAIALRRVVSNG